MLAKVIPDVNLPLSESMHWAQSHVDYILHIVSPDDGLLIAGYELLIWAPQ